MKVVIVPLILLSLLCGWLAYLIWPESLLEKNAQFLALASMGFGGLANLLLILVVAAIMSGRGGRT